MSWTQLWQDSQFRDAPVSACTYSHQPGSIIRQISRHIYKRLRYGHWRIQRWGPAPGHQPTIWTRWSSWWRWRFLGDFPDPSVAVEMPKEASVSASILWNGNWLCSASHQCSSQRESGAMGEDGGACGYPVSNWADNRPVASYALLWAVNKSVVFLLVFLELRKPLLKYK